MIRVLFSGFMVCLAGDAGAFDLQAHRGGRGLAPENTLPAFENALAIGVTTLEADLAMTRDGVLVLSHDPRLNPALTRGADGRWLTTSPAIFSLSMDELEAFDVGRLDPESAYGRQWAGQKASDGARIPPRAALFELARDRRSPGGAPIRFNIETKVAPRAEVPTADAVTFAQAVVTAVRRAGMTDRVTVQSFDWSTLLEVHRLAPGTATACLTIESANMNTLSPGTDGASPWHAGLKLADFGNSLPRLARASGCSTWSPFWRNVTEPVVAEAHGLGLRVVPWTLNEPADMERMIDLGVDGLITDYPDRARRVLAARGVSID